MKMTAPGHVGGAAERSRALPASFIGGCAAMGRPALLGLWGSVVQPGLAALLPVSGLLHGLIPLSGLLTPFNHVNFYSPLSGSWSWIRSAPSHPFLQLLLALTTS